MTLYSDNPNLDLKTVSTISGDKEYRRNCKFIGGKYYLMDRDCFEIEGKWYRIDGGNIIYDHELKVWVHKNNADGLIRGAVDFKGTAVVFGYFTRNVYENASFKSKTDGTVVAMNTKILEDAGYFEDVATSNWYRLKDMTLSDIKHRKTIRNEKNFTDRGYNIEDNPGDFKFKTKSYAEYELDISKKAREMAKYLGDYTFGCEIEIGQGNLPERILNRHGVVICRDGSIDGGPELVTIPLAGAKGIQNIVDLCSELKLRGDVSIACALHLHFGNVRTDKLFLTAFYLLCRKIQEELFTMFPYYKTDPTGVKRKNYNQKLQKLSIHPLVEKDKGSYEVYLQDVNSKIFDFLAEGKMTMDQLNKKTREHPIRQKWDRHSRYYWANMMNMYFTNRNTIEFRLHGPTTNSHKIINWMFICTAIIKYAETNAATIISSKAASIPLKNVFGIFGELHPNDPKAAFVGEYLYAYFQARQKRVNKDIENGDRLSMWDINEDKKFEFTFNGVTGLV